MNVQTIILLAVLLILAALATVFVIKHKSISKCAGCTGDCSKCHGCPENKNK